MAQRRHPYAIPEDPRNHIARLAHMTSAMRGNLSAARQERVFADNQALQTDIEQALFFLDMLEDMFEGEFGKATEAYPTPASLPPSYALVVPVLQRPSSPEPHIPDVPNAPVPNRRMGRYGGATIPLDMTSSPPKKVAKFLEAGW